jgi:hypothetical protein
MKKQRFFHEFAIILLLVVSIGIIAFQTNSHFTGFAVLGQYTNQSDCLAANYTWQNNTELQNVTSQIEVVIGGTCFNVTYTDEANCITNNYTWQNNTELQNVTSQIEVIVERCIGEEVVCVEDWNCDSWEECSGGTQTRTCTDSVSCGTTTNRPILERDCEVPEEETEDTSITTEAIINTPVEAEVTQTCIPNLQCGDWQECINGTQIKVCTDLNSCNPDEIASTESQACVVEIKETCSDKIKNQDETGIDCGGKCKKCGFFTIVGSVVSGTVNSVLGNQTRIFIFSGVLLVIIAGFFAFKFFFKKKKRLKG